MARYIQNREPRADLVALPELPGDVDRLPAKQRLHGASRDRLARPDSLGVTGAAPGRHPEPRGYGFGASDVVAVGVSDQVSRYVVLPECLDDPADVRPEPRIDEQLTDQVRVDEAAGR